MKNYYCGVAIGLAISVASLVSADERNFTGSNSNNPSSGSGQGDCSDFARRRETQGSWTATRSSGEDNFGPTSNTSNNSATPPTVEGGSTPAISQATHLDVSRDNAPELADHLGQALDSNPKLTPESCVAIVIPGDYTVAGPAHRVEDLIDYLNKSSGDVRLPMGKGMYRVVELR